MSNSLYQIYASRTPSRGHHLVLLQGSVVERGVYSPPRLLEIQCRITSESVRQEGSLPHTCVMSEEAEGIQV